LQQRKTTKEQVKMISLLFDNPLELGWGVGAKIITKPALQKIKNR